MNKIKNLLVIGCLLQGCHDDQDKQQPEPVAAPQPMEVVRTIPVDQFRAGTMDKGTFIYSTRDSVSMLDLNNDKSTPLTRKYQGFGGPLFVSADHRVIASPMYSYFETYIDNGEEFALAPVTELTANPLDLKLTAMHKIELMGNSGHRIFSFGELKNNAQFFSIEIKSDGSFNMDSIDLGENHGAPWRVSFQSLEGRAYAAYQDGQLLSFYISDKQAGVVHTAQPGVPALHAEAFVVKKDRYLVTAQGNVLNVFDLTDQTKKIENIRAPENSFIREPKLLLMGDKLVQWSRTTPYLDVWSLTDPMAPAYLGRIHIEGGLGIMSMHAIDKDRLLMAFENRLVVQKLK